MTMVNRFLSQLSDRQDLVFVLLFALVVAMLVVPLPTIFIDILLAVNICLSLVILMVALYLRNVLDLSTFPAIILVSTIFRLALTVSTTRLILAQGDAGKIIQAFGNFVVAGNIVVGLVIFFIVAIVQFIVVTKGAERIAEVSARFTLDALPGKQMAIDADVRAGDTTKEEARRRRFILEKESQFFGSMDGAMRFVKGDAIASLVIVFVNLFGGILIGTFQQGMPFREAAKLYSLLTVGDGLVAQIPSMLIAVAAGAVVTRVVTEDSVDLGQDIGRQLAGEPRTLGIASGMSACLAFVPGFPSLVFLTLAAFLGGIAWLIMSRRRTAANVATEEAEREAPVEKVELAVAPAGAVFMLAGPEDLKKEINATGELAQAIKQEWAEQAIRFGFPIKMLGYRIMPELSGLHLMIDNLSVLQILDPLAEEPRAVARSIWASMEPKVSKLFDSDVVVEWLGDLKSVFPRAVTDIDQSLRALFVMDVGRELLDDGLTLAQPRIILETLMRAKEMGLSPVAVAEMARSGLRQHLLQSRRTAGGELPVIIIDFGFESQIRQMGQRIVESPLLVARDPAVSPALAQIRSMLAAAEASKLTPVVICQQDVRRPLRALLQAAGISVTTMSLNEIDPAITLNTIGTAGHVASPQVRPTGPGNINMPIGAFQT